MAKDGLFKLQNINKWSFSGATTSLTGIEAF
jgi:hypothetical protein